MQIENDAVTMLELNGGELAAMHYGRCPAGRERHCFTVRVETQETVQICEFFDQGNPADDEPQCTHGIDFRPLP